MVTNDLLVAITSRLAASIPGIDDPDGRLIKDMLLELRKLAKVERAALAVEKEYSASGDMAGAMAYLRQKLAEAGN